MIRVYTGPMFSGKTNGLLNVYNNMWNKDIIQCYKPKVDNRDYGIIKSRNNTTELRATLIEDLKELKETLKPNVTTIFIDEFQFLTGDVKSITDMSLYEDKDFYISGLAMTSELEPFGIMPNIMAVADEITFYDATCYYCNKPAKFTLYRGNDIKGKVLVGNNEYVPACGKCYIKNKHK